MDKTAYRINKLFLLARGSRIQHSPLNLSQNSLQYDQGDKGVHRKHGPPVCRKAWTKGGDSLLHAMVYTGTTEASLLIHLLALHSQTHKQKRDQTLLTAVAKDVRKFSSR